MNICGIIRLKPDHVVTRDGFKKIRMVGATEDFTREATAVNEITTPSFSDWSDGT